MLRNRIQPDIGMYQNGFRNNRSTMEQILTVRRIVEVIKENNLKACIIFVDFSKVFDSIDMNNISEILK